NIDNSTITAGAEPKQYTVYSKKFAASGTFEDNAGNNAFSLTPSTIYTEEWHIWIMASSKATSGTNPWNSYGANAEGSAGSSNGIGSTTVDLSKYYLYTVPAGQKDTLFGFVSVGYVNSSTTADKAKTYGNFLDNINFQLYHPLSSSTTDHGSAVVGGSDGTTEGEGGSDGHEVTVNNKLATYITDGEPLKIQAIVKKADADAGCEFVGLYYTTLDENGDPVTKFLQLAGNEIEDTGSLTEEQKKGKWIKSTNTDGDIIYTYYLENITSATDLHFVFIKNPTITYDPNGGKAYVVERTYNTEEAPNVYNFKPAVLTENTSGVDTTTGATPTTSPTEKFISPYVSHAAEGQNDGWKFMGWLLTGDTVDNIPSDVAQVNAGQLGSLLLPAVHTVACDYSLSNVSTSAAQYFKIYGESVTTSATLNKENGEVKGVTWTDNGETKVYANVHKGLTMVAQWRWRQAFIPQVDSSTNYTDSANGGTVEIASVTDKSDTNYNAAYNANGGKSYHAETDETITATATAKDGFTFEGWYDASGNLITTNTTYTYTETKASVNTYYARFSGSVTQTYIRQIKNGDTWEDTTDDKIGTLGRYTYTDAVGTPISSTATAGTGYKFLGWYDEHGKPVADTMLTNYGKTISYVTTGDATYYARFSRIMVVNQTFIRQVKNEGIWKDTTDDNIGTLTFYGHTGEIGKSVSSAATAAEESGYIFVGWYDALGKPVADTMLTDGGKTISYVTTGDATYYARFSRIIVTFDPDGGNVTPTSDIAIEGKLNNLPVPTRSNYNFDGWFTQPSGGTIVTIDRIYTEDTTIYAHWSYAGGEDPGTGGYKPDTGGEDPGTGEDNPGSGGEDPGTGEDNPGSGSEDPGTGEDNPGSGSEDPGTGEDNPGSSSGNHENVEHNSTAENLPPRTADDSDLVIWFMLLALSMCCFTAFLIKSKHSSEENHK
ncbi:MAG: InlB B-repeat-containing protein, partial [Firmicutes bacterium]|nr:InlB B-repeat-containing protein [Bacillota bacterium]